MENITNLTGQLANLTNTTRILDAPAVSFAREFIPLVISRLWDLISAPFSHQEMLWIIFPLLLTFFVLEFYFDRHGDEELGWAAAVANSLILFIVAMDLLKHSFPGSTPFQVLGIVWDAIFTEAILPLQPQVLILIIFIGCLGMTVTLINYYHLLPKGLAFEVSGHPPINFLAYLAIAIVYTAGTPEEIPLDLATLVAAPILYVLLLLIVFGIRLILRRMIAGKSRSIWSS